MRILNYLPLILLLALISACRQASTQEHRELFAFWPTDSIKHALRTQELTVAEEMVASGSIGIRQFIAGEFDSARHYLNRALSMPGGREWQGGRFLVNLANSYGFQGQYAEALKYYMEALQLSERLASSTDKETAQFAQWNIIRSMANMSEIHYLTGNREQALHYALLARERWEGEDPIYITPQYLYIIGSVYLDMGKLDEAEEIMQETFGISDAHCRHCLQEVGDPHGMYMYVAYGQEGLARVYLARGDHDQALEHATRALGYAHLHGDPSVTAKMLAVLSDIYMAQGNYQESGQFARRAMELFPEHGKLNPEALFNIATAHLFEGDMGASYDYFNLYSKHVRENTATQFRETVAGLQVQYEIEKKETRIASLEQERRLYLLVGLLGILFIFALVVVSRQKIRQQRQEKRLVAANAIFEWEKKERKRFASDMHDGINGMLSAVKIELNTTQRLPDIVDKLDDCIETIRRMARGMMPSSLERYGLKAALEDYCRLFPNVEFHFFGEEMRINDKVELMIYYCAYELVNNSYKHSGAKEIHVQFVQDCGSITLTVQDDGCGFDPESVTEDSGLKNIRDRIAAINGRVDIVTVPGQGTETNIEWNSDSL